MDTPCRNPSCPHGVPSEPGDHGIARYCGDCSGRVTCLINCFNYEEFVGEAIASAFAQTHPFDEIIVVDDGSTDGSAAAIQRALDEQLLSAGNGVRAELMTKPNGGQLSSFHAGLERATGEIVYFLDADDAFEPDYVERTMPIYRERPEIGFVTVGYRMFGGSDRVNVDKRGSRDQGFSVLNALLRGGWVGNVTSTISARREVLDRFMPLPDRFLADWRISADDCLIYGSSVAGARKYFLAEPLMRYRKHDKNAFLGKPECRYRKFEKKAAVSRLLTYLGRFLDRSTEPLGDTLHLEFCTVEKPSSRELRHYLRMASRTRLPFLRTQRNKWTMIRHFLDERKRAKRER